MASAAISREAPISVPTTSSFSRKLKIIAVEFWATVKHVLPATVKWFWNRHITKKTQSFKIEATVSNTNKVATLYFNGIKNDKKAVLLCPGDHASPASMQHLAKVLGNRPIYTLSIPKVHDNSQVELNDQLLTNALQKINQLGATSIVGVGHSKGAILLANRFFVKKDPNLAAVCSIAGRLRNTDSKLKDPHLKAIVESITAHYFPSPNFIQIVPEEDWNSTQEEMILNHQTAFSVPGMHLSGLFAKETKEHVQRFVELS